MTPSATPSNKINKFLNRSLALKGGKQKTKTWERRSGRSFSYHCIYPVTELLNLQQILVSFDVTAQRRTLFGIDRVNQVLLRSHIKVVYMLQIPYKCIIGPKAVKAKTIT